MLLDIHICIQAAYTYTLCVKNIYTVLLYTYIYIYIYMCIHIDKYWRYGVGAKRGMGQANGVWNFLEVI